ncbi:MAG: T9SS type A sorting domain-containing protein [Bacteroidales bacterium]|nr:T9SS type A sorting domain-containing protein [Bacteroidales bacterium]MCF8457748.1 T9SS type A sorting domain-containing protein [Bacteroidales bacterium]
MKTKNLLTGMLFLSFVFCLGLGNINAQNKNKSPQHFSGVINTGDNMTIGIPEYAWNVKPQMGDEVGAFNSDGKMVGSTVYNGGNLAITVWGDDETTKLKEGVSSGKRFTLRLWHKASGAESVIEVANWLEGDDIYKSNGISVVEKLQLASFTESNGEYTLGQNIPNPAKDFTKIDYSIPVNGHVKIVLFTTDGKLVRDLLSEEMPAGTHTLEVNVSDLAAGTYYYKMMTADFSGSKYLNIVR